MLKKNSYVYKTNNWLNKLYKNLVKYKLDYIDLKTEY